MRDNQNLSVYRIVDGFRSNIEGGVTVFGLYAFIIVMMVMGLALDRANGWRVRNQLQVASDAAALAAAANLDDLDVARAVAIETASRNLPGNTGAFTEEDIVFGSLDPDTLEFVASANEDGDYTAVSTNAGRTEERGNSVTTLLLSTIGIPSLNVNTASIALASGEEGVAATCHDALFLSTSAIQTGGGNDFEGAVCIHGANGVSTGGGDRLNEEVRFTAASESSINLNSYSPSYLQREDLVAERTLAPVLLPELSNMRNSIWDDLWISRSEDASLWEQPDAPWGGKLWYYVGEYVIHAADYDGILPDFIFDDAGTARVEMHDQYWSIQDSDLEEHTIYLSEQSMQFSGGVDIENAAFISQGNIGIGGGSALFFDNVYFIGTSLNMAGSITWGDATNPCDVDFGVYLFGINSLSLGGWYSGASVSGMVGAAPNFDPGGGMTGTGVYFETDSFLNMGGNYDLYGCDLPRESDISLTDPSISGNVVTAGSVLFR